MLPVDDAPIHKLGAGIEGLSALASAVTLKPANGGQGKTGQRKWPGLGCSTLQPPVEASPFLYANSEDRI